MGNTESQIQMFFFFFLFISDQPPFPSSTGKVIAITWTYQFWHWRV